MISIFLLIIQGYKSYKVKRKKSIDTLLPLVIIYGKKFVNNRFCEHLTWKSKWSCCKKFSKKTPLYWNIVFFRLNIKYVRICAWAQSQVDFWFAGRKNLLLSIEKKRFFYATHPLCTPTILYLSIDGKNHYDTILNFDESFDFNMLILVFVENYVYISYDFEYIV